MSAKKKTEVVEETVTAEDINELVVGEVRQLFYFCDNHYHSQIPESEGSEVDLVCDVCGDPANHVVSLEDLHSVTLRLLGKAG